MAVAENAQTQRSAENEIERAIRKSTTPKSLGRGISTLILQEVERLAHRQNGGSGENVIDLEFNPRVHVTRRAGKKLRMTFEMPRGGSVSYIP